jgi:hypothetical protein
MERDRDPAYAGSNCGALPACRRHSGRQVIIFKLLKTKQVFADNQINLSPINEVLKS